MWNFLPSFRCRKVNLTPGWARSFRSGHCCPAAWYCALKKNVQKQYTDKEFDSSTINLWDNDKGEQPIVFLPSVLMIANCCMLHVPRRISLSLLQLCWMELTIVVLLNESGFSYGVHWRTISSLCIVFEKCLLLHLLGSSRSKRMMPSLLCMRLWNGSSYTLLWLAGLSL